MMEFVSAAVAVFSLLSVGQSAPVSTCESLVQPLEIPSRDQLLGKWTHIAESTSLPGSTILTKTLMGSVWANITAAEESDKIYIFQNQKMLEMCFSMKTEMILSNNTLTLVQPFHATSVQMSTRCPDCLVFSSSYTIGNSTYSSLQLLSRRRAVSAEELEAFKKQVECVNLPPPAILDPEKGFCPPPSSSQETMFIDMTGNVTSEYLDELDKLLNEENGVQLFIKMVVSAMDLLQGNQHRGD